VDSRYVQVKDIGPICSNKLIRISKNPLNPPLKKGEAQVKETPEAIFTGVKPEENKIKISSIFSKIGGQAPEETPTRFERKYAVLPADSGLALSLLRHVCRADKNYPVDRVTSLYFDTADLDQYEKAGAGEHRKDKVRIRWYGSDMRQNGEIPVYLEQKIRQGFASSKHRQKFIVPVTALKTENLNRGILDRTTILNTLASFGYFPEKPLKPIIKISYRRHRFSEMMTGDRVSFDEDIRAVLVAPELVRKEGEIRLPNGVIEVKGTRLELPVMLRQLRIMDLDWSRFSKYGNCLEIFFDEPGSVSRNWPSGRLVLP
jgi:hypothetical protein